MKRDIPMPTENRSSTIEQHDHVEGIIDMVSATFQHEDRYIVIKRSDLAKVPVAYRSALVDPVFHLQAHLPQRECLVIESDWPEFEPTWASIKARVTGQPAQKLHPEPIAWMVGTAIWWTKEEAERDAEAMGLPVIPVGPLGDIALAREMLRRADRREGKWALLCCGRNNQIAQLRAQLAEQDAMLRKISGYHWANVDPEERAKTRAELRDMLSPSAGQSAPAEADEPVCKGAWQLGTGCGKCRRCRENSSV